MSSTTLSDPTHWRRPETTAPANICERRDARESRETASQRRNPPQVTDLRPTPSKEKVKAVDQHTRCAWARTSLSIAYHDLEWGVPVHDDNILFEFLTLEGAQAGLSWETILKKRDTYRQAFVGFDAAR